MDLFFDPGNAYSIPWAAGITGIGYNRALTGRDLDSGRTCSTRVRGTRRDVPGDA